MRYLEWLITTQESNIRSQVVLASTKSNVKDIFWRIGNAIV